MNNHRLTPLFEDDLTVGRALAYALASMGQPKLAAAALGDTGSQAVVQSALASIESETARAELLDHETGRRLHKKSRATK